MKIGKDDEILWLLRRWCPKSAKLIDEKIIHETTGCRTYISLKMTHDDGAKAINASHLTDFCNTESNILINRSSLPIYSFSKSSTELLNQSAINRIFDFDLT